MRNEELFKERPVWNAILTLAIPSVLSILVMLLYNMADMFFVGLLHDHVQVAAVSVVGPIFSLVTAAATMVGIGGCAAIAKAAGAGEVDYAKTCASLCGWFCILFGTAAALILLGYANSLLPVLGATPEMMKHSATYLRVLAIGTPFMLFGTGFAPLLRADGAVKIGFLGNLAGTILNLLLDPVLILGFSMGVTGAAAATVLGNMLSSSIYLWYVFRKSGILTLHPHFALREPQALLHIFALGLPNAVSGVLSGFASTFSNRLLNPYGTEALAAMGAAGKVTMLITLVQMGVCMGVQPLMAYNYGANDLSRLKEILQKLALLTVFLGAASTVICCLIRKSLIRVFLRDETAATMGEQLVIWLLLAGPLLGLYYLSSNFLQASGSAATATLVSILRQGAILIPSLYVLSAWQGFTGIAAAHTVADVLASIMALVLCLRRFRRVVAKKAYAGINRHDGEKVGGYDTVVSGEDYSKMFSLQQESMETPEPSPADISAVAAQELPKAPAIHPQPVLPKPPKQTITTPPPQKKEIDTSNIKVGSVLRHKAFGLGTVKELKGGRIIVTFDGVEKLFQFPGAVQQGFLSIPE